ncbi:MAG TPA: DUF3551 domain-containing protein [Xanthobacteraceae bacterium]|nr:DUF3551 domain-containing protein [Xanthobacteraceae bacterium]
MRPTHIIYAAVMLLVPCTASHAQSAYDYPWCAVYGDSDGPGSTSCYYATREQCLRTLSGIGGTCIRSPFYGHGPRNERSPPRGRRDY